ncbi:unnamed protein product [Parnassius mnemosyne]|uniref:Uncharacterized protein n=1 Tax=Parnassius mnemosyne TaxID=213953 RepID=A0AAV1LCQ8_9NEOP
MFQYEYEKRPASANSCDSRATMTPDWRVYSTAGSSLARANADRARRPLPPRPIVCERMPTKTTVPLKVWIIASASCFAVCAALVLATVVITKWGATERYPTRELFEAPEPIYYNPRPQPQPTKPSPKPTTEETTTTSMETENEIQNPILEKLSIFKNVVGDREKNKKSEEKTLVSKPQLHPLHDSSLYHQERRIEKKHQAIYPRQEAEQYPNFKPTLPDLYPGHGLPIEGYVAGVRRYDDVYDEYYNDDALYDDYMQSNTMTSYLIEKVQELHDWITSDPDFKNVTRKRNSTNEFGQVLKALNESLVEGNVSVIMGKLKELYFGENYTLVNHTRKVIRSNSTDLLSFGILTLDVMLLHNIQLMAWENQEAARVKMLKDPEVFAFNALFLEPGKVEAKKNEVYHHESVAAKRQSRPETAEEFDFGKNLLENVLEIGMSTARAAIHLGRAYKNTKLLLSQLSNRDNLNTNIQNQLSRNIDGNTHALNHLQTSYNKNDSSDSVASNKTENYTDLDCIWFLYCKNLIATSKLNAPYGTMARINGLALRMLTGELATERALDTMLYEALTGWTELRCPHMFPRCSKVNAAAVVMDSIVLPTKKLQSSNRER